MPRRIINVDKINLKKRISLKSDRSVTVKYMGEYKPSVDTGTIYVFSHANRDNITVLHECAGMIHVLSLYDNWVLPPPEIDWDKPIGFKYGGRYGPLSPCRIVDKNFVTEDGEIQWLAIIKDSNYDNSYLKDYDCSISITPKTGKTIEGKVVNI